MSKHTPGPWGYIPSNENHGPYVVNEWGAGDICDCYTMTNPDSLSVRNGGDSKPVHFQHDEADANAKLISLSPNMFTALEQIVKRADNGDLGTSKVQDMRRFAAEILAKFGDYK